MYIYLCLYMFIYAYRFIYTIYSYKYRLLKLLSFMKNVDVAMELISETLRQSTLYIHRFIYIYHHHRNHYHHYYYKYRLLKLLSFMKNVDVAMELISETLRQSTLYIHRFIYIYHHHRNHYHHYYYKYRLLKLLSFMKNVDVAMELISETLRQSTLYIHRFIYIYHHHRNHYHHYYYKYRLLKLLSFMKNVDVAMELIICIYIYVFTYLYMHIDSYILYIHINTGY
jgi:hypothetical protein